MGQEYRLGRLFSQIAEQRTDDSSAACSMQDFPATVQEEQMLALRRKKTQWHSAIFLIRYIVKH
jgi:hypothetical protein